MKFIHVADLHLDTPFSGISKIDLSLQSSLIDSTYHAFESCVDFAIEKKVDLVIIAGDIYDASKQTVHAKTFFYQQINRLSKSNIYVVICHGNHDYLSNERLIIYPEHVFQFSSEKVTTFKLVLKSGETVQVHGFSYQSKWITKSKISEYPMRNKEVDFEIGILHGSLITGTDRDNYAPFTIDELISRNYDYWALGHVHKQEQLHKSPIIQYSGVIQGKHRKESGPKGFYYLELEKNKPTRSTLIDVAPIIWQDMTITCSAEMQLAQLLEVIDFETEPLILEGNKSYLITLQLEEFDALDDDLKESIESGELEDHLETKYKDGRFLKIIKINYLRHSFNNVFNYDKALSLSYQDALKDLKRETEVNLVIKDLMRHPTMNEWLKDVIEDIELKESMIDKADHLISRVLSLKDRGDNHENKKT